MFQILLFATLKLNRQRISHSDGSPPWSVMVHGDKHLIRYFATVLNVLNIIMWYGSKKCTVLEIKVETHFATNVLLQSEIP